jgi:hypothetical protein
VGTQLVYRDIGTPVLFTDTSATNITLNNLAAGAGRVSDVKDRTAADLPVYHLWQGKFQFETAPVIGEVVEIWLFESDGTLVDGVVGAVDAALTAGPKTGGKLIGVVLVQHTNVDADHIASGVFEIWQRYYSIGVWNATADNLAAHNDVSSVTVTPLSWDIQAAA